MIYQYQFFLHSSIIFSHHTQEPNAVITAGIVKRPIVLLMHDHGRKDFLRQYSSLSYSKNIYLIHNSNWLKEYYSGFGFQNFVLYPPVFWKDYETETSRQYITLINCNKNKGGEVLIKIAKKMSDLQFMGVKGAYNKQIIDSRVSNILYIPQTPYIKSVYAKTGILLMPSKEESWGRTAIEAMSSGIPVIAHPTPGLLESCGDAGIFCDREKPDTWIAAIRRLKTDAEYYKSVSDLCRARAKELDPTPQLKEMSLWLQGLKWQA